VVFKATQRRAYILGPCQQVRDSHDPLGVKGINPTFWLMPWKRGFWEKEKAGETLGQAQRE